MIRWMLVGIALLTGTASAEVSVRGRVSSVVWNNGMLSIVTGGAYLRRRTRRRRRAAAGHA